MSENYIVINGKKAELTQEQLEALGIEVKKPNNPFERASMGENYFFMTTYGAIEETDDTCRIGDTSRLEVANYCTDKNLLQQQAYRETLNRLLWRFSMEHGGEKVIWNDCTLNWKIKFYNNKWIAEWNKSDHVLGCVYFAYESAAKQAIEEVVKPFMASHPDFKL